ncbi:MAG TPA: hypothetical protein VFN97_20615 [Actinospica sp.]|nr:hypothetical protein [Actinospica sp.]
MDRIVVRGQVEVTDRQRRASRVATTPTRALGVAAVAGDEHVPVAGRVVEVGIDVLKIRTLAPKFGVVPPPELLGAFQFLLALPLHV